MKIKYMTLLIIAISAISISTALNIEPKKPKLKLHNESNNLNENFLRNEIQNTVLEFIEEVNLNPDSCYIPFKDSIN